MYQYKECGLSNVELLSGYKINDTPYGKSITIADVKRLHKSIGMELAKKPGLLSAEEIRFLRKELGLSPKLLAQTLSVAELLVRGWEAGKARISGPADRLLRVLYKKYVDPESLACELLKQLSRVDSQVQMSSPPLEFEILGNAWVKHKIE